MPRRNRWPALVIGLAAGTAGLCAVLLAAVSAIVARIVVTPNYRQRDDVRIRGVSHEDATITLSTTPETATPGRYSFWFSADRGLARVGDVVDGRSDTGVTTRRLDSIVFGDLDRARRGWISGWWYHRPEEVNDRVEEVMIPVDGGRAPGWLLGDRSSVKWAIHIHGRGTRRQETLRGVPAFSRQGYASLVVSYRNDRDAPYSADRRYGLGLTEWHDVDAAIGFARRNGAQHIVLVGWSMGGAIALQTLARSAHADSVAGIVLDSPVIDWTDTLQHHARLMHLPRIVTRAALRLVTSTRSRLITGQSEPLRFDELDFVNRAWELTRPILLLHSDGDDYVPPGPSRRLAALRPDIVTYVRFGRARHTKLWNVDSMRWEAEVAAWLTALPTR